MTLSCLKGLWPNLQEKRQTMHAGHEEVADAADEYLASKQVVGVECPLCTYVTLA